MKSTQFTIRSLLVATLVAGLLLPFAVVYYDRVMQYLFPAKPPLVVQQPAAARIPAIKFAIKNAKEGVVLRVKDDLAAISIGSDDGLVGGEKVSFYRNEKAIGSGVVQRVKDNMSACEVIDGELAEGDYVTIAK